MRKVLLTVIVLLNLFLSSYALADCPGMPYFSTDINWWFYSSDGSGQLGDWCAQGYNCTRKSISLQRYYNCSCGSHVPPPTSPYTEDPNDPPPGTPPGSPAAPENGGPPSDCDCTVERVCYDSSNEPIYFELDCCGTLFVYGDITLSIRCFRTDGVTPGPPVGLGGVPPLIQDPDSGWNMPEIYSGPAGDYDQPNSADSPDTDGDGIPDYADLKPNGLADGSDNPRWREISFSKDGDGNKVGGLYEIEGQEGYYSWGDTAPEGGTDYVTVGGGWQSPESFADNSSGGGWSSSGGGGGAVSYGSYNPNAIPVDPQNPTSEEIAEWEASSPPDPINFGEVQQPESTPETNSGSSGDSSAVVDADLREVSKILSGIEQDQKVYGSAEILKLEEIINLLTRSNLNDSDLLDDPSLAGGYYQHLGTYYDSEGLPCGWLIVKGKNTDATGDLVTHMIGKRSVNFIQESNNWLPISDLWNESNPWSGHAGESGWVDGGSESGSDSGLTGSDVQDALAADRAAGDVEGQTARSVAEAALDASGEPSYLPYDESDIPDYTQDQTDYETELNNLKNSSSISSVRDALGIQTSGATSSMSCQLCGQTITFDFAPHATLLQSIGTMWVSLCYLSGFLIIMRC